MAFTHYNAGHAPLCPGAAEFCSISCTLRLQIELEHVQPTLQYISRHDLNALPASLDSEPLTSLQLVADVKGFKLTLNSTSSFV